MNMQTHETGPEPQNRWYDHFFLFLFVQRKNVSSSDSPKFRWIKPSRFWFLFFFFLSAVWNSEKQNRKKMHARTNAAKVRGDWNGEFCRSHPCVCHSLATHSERNAHSEPTTDTHKNYINTQLQIFKQKQQRIIRNKDERTRFANTCNRPDSTQHTNRFNWCGILSGFYHKHQHFLLSRITTIHIAWNMNLTLLRRIYL